MRWLLVLLLSSVISHLSSSPVMAQTDANWYTAGANFQRTSWVSEEVDGSLRVEWYQPIEAFVDFKTQPIAVDGVLFIATSRGLYAIYANDPDGTGPRRGGDLKWRFDTDMPVATPTVINNVVYLPGYDGRIYAMNASNGSRIWYTPRAGAAFETTPVVANGMVYNGNRDGRFYAFDLTTGQSRWQFPAGGDPLTGSISQSAAYYDNQSGTRSLYFPANDMYAYALNADTGTLRWKSQNKLPGQDFRDYWPVIVENYVVFVSNHPYRTIDTDGYLYTYLPLLYPNGTGDFNSTFTTGSLEDRTGITWPWPNGSTIMDMNRLTGPGGILEQNRHLITHTFLDINNGNPLAYPAPYLLATNNGNGSTYPPIVMQEGQQDIMYQTVFTRYGGSLSSNQMTLAGWLIGTPYVRLVGGPGVTNEPEEFSAGGKRIYRKRYTVTGESRNIIDSANGGISTYWSSSNSITGQAPDLRQMLNQNDSWCFTYEGMVPDKPSPSSFYCNGRASPLVPHQDRLYLLYYNTLIAFGPDGGSRKVDNTYLAVHPPSQSVSPMVPTTADLVNKLEFEVRKILEVYNQNPNNPNRFLQPGYYNDGVVNVRQHASYFSNPGDTLYTLSLAYNHITNSPANGNLRDQIRNYLTDYYNYYFGTTSGTACDNTATTSIVEPCVHTGWQEGSSRNAMIKPPNWLDSISTYDRRNKTALLPNAWPWLYPQHNFYAMWKYVDLVKDRDPSTVQNAYNKAASLVRFDNPESLRTTLIEFPSEVQMYMAGYQGFIGLCDLAGAACNASLRQNAVITLTLFDDFRRDNFTKDSIWFNRDNVKRRFNIAVNFMWLTPGAADLLSQNLRLQIQEALDEYNYVAPLWFVGGLQISYQENSTNHLFDSPALFQAKAWILNQPREELYKYLDAPYFERGDLFYIQNLVALIEAPSDPNYTPPPPSPSPTPFLGFDGDGDVDFIDFGLLLSRFNQTFAAYNLVGTGLIDIFDFNRILYFL